MNAIPSQLLKDYVNSQQFSSTKEVLSAMKELFRDVLQQVMECELGSQLGYEKRQRESETAVESELKNYRNGYSKKTVKPSLARLWSRCHGIVMGAMSPRSSANIIGMLMGWKTRFYRSIPVV